MSLLPLENPLTRLNLFPNTMNYRGGWSATVQYYVNDVAISVADSNTYILTGKTTLIGGGDPSMNADWEAIGSSGGGTGVQSVTAAALTGVENIGTAQNVVLVNTGVISVTTNTLDGIENIGTAQNQQLVNTGVLSVTTVPSSGISISGPANKPVLANDGVITVTTLPASGISITGPATNPILANDGVISIVPSTGISITGPVSSPTIENTGIISITGGTGISVTAGQNPTIDVSGLVVSCTTPAVPTNGGILIGGTAANPSISWAPLASGTASLTVPTTGPFGGVSIVTSPFPLSQNAMILLNISPLSQAFGLNIDWLFTAIDTEFSIGVGTQQTLTAGTVIKIQWAIIIP